MTARRLLTLGSQSVVRAECSAASQWAVRQVLTGQDVRLPGGGSAQFAAVLRRHAGGVQFGRWRAELAASRPLGRNRQGAGRQPA